MGRSLAALANRRARDNGHSKRKLRIPAKPPGDSGTIPPGCGGLLACGFLTSDWREGQAWGRVRRHYELSKRLLAAVAAPVDLWATPFLASRTNPQDSAPMVVMSAPWARPQRRRRRALRLPYTKVRNGARAAYIDRTTYR